MIARYEPCRFRAGVGALLLRSDLLTYRLGKMARNHPNDEAGDAVSCCIVAVCILIAAVRDGGSHSRSSRLDRSWLGFFAPSGCEPKPVRFFNHLSAPASPVATCPCTPKSGQVPRLLCQELKLASMKVVRRHIRREENKRLNLAGFHRYDTILVLQCT